MFAMPALQPGNICIIDIVGVFVRVSGPTETDRSRQTHRDKLTETDRPKRTDRDRQTHTQSVRAASSAKRCEYTPTYEPGVPNEWLFVPSTEWM